MWVLRPAASGMMVMVEYCPQGAAYKDRRTLDVPEQQSTNTAGYYMRVKKRFRVGHFASPRQTGSYRDLSIIS